MKYYNVNGKKLTEQQVRQLASRKKAAVANKSTRFGRIRPDYDSMSELVSFMAESVSGIASDLIVSNISESSDNQSSSSSDYYSQPSVSNDSGSSDISSYSSSYDSGSSSSSYDSGSSYDSSSSSSSGGDF